MSRDYDRARSGGRFDDDDGQFSRSPERERGLSGARVDNRQTTRRDWNPGYRGSRANYGNYGYGNYGGQSHNDDENWGYERGAGRASTDDDNEQRYTNRPSPEYGDWDEVGRDRDIDRGSGWMGMGRNREIGDSFFDTNRGRYSGFDADREHRMSEGDIAWRGGRDAGREQSAERVAEGYGRQRRGAEGDTAWRGAGWSARSDFYAGGSERSRHGYEQVDDRDYGRDYGREERRDPASYERLNEGRGGWRRVEGDQVWTARGPHSGRGPRGWRRSDERIREDASERLADHPRIDASDIEMTVQDGEITLEGTVDSRWTKRAAEDAVQDISGVQEVHNRLRVRRDDRMGAGWDSSGADRNRYEDRVQSATMGAGAMNTAGVSGAVATDRLQAAPNMEVVGTDMSAIGSIKETRGDRFLIDRPMQRDVWAPSSAIQSVSDSRVVLNLTAADVDNQGWDSPDMMGTDEGADEASPAR